MCKVTRLFRQAKEIAVKGSKIRQHKLGAIGVRKDGTIVKSNNLSNRLPEVNAHAEARVVKKMDYGGTVYVVRVLATGALAMARPCRKCQNVMRLKGIERCYYSVNDDEYGVLVL